MAASDGRRKRTWRFRLNEHEILEVSAPRGATEKQVRRRGRISLIVGTVAAALMVSAVASADQLAADADALATATPHGNGLTANQQPGTTVEYDLSAYVNASGNTTDDVFKVAGDTVDVAITRSGDWLSSPAGSPASFSFTAYSSNQAGKIRVTVPCGTSAGTSRAMTAVLTAGASYNALNAGNSSGKTLNPNTQTLTYTITAQGTDAASCTPTNQPPSADAGGPYSVDEGGSVGLSGSGSDPDGDLLTYAWDLDNNGSFETPGQNVTFSAAGLDGPGTRTVVLEACDEEDACDTSPTTVTIDNVAPSGTFNVPTTSVDEGSSFNLALSDVTDPSGADVAAGFQFKFDCGAGYGSYGTSGSTSCTTAVDGPATLTVKGMIKDKDGGEREYTSSVDVSNVAPSITSLVAGAAASCGAASLLTINFSDPAGSYDTYSATIDWGDGSTSNPTGIASGHVASHPYTSAGQHTVTVTVSDEDGGTSTSMTQTLVVNYNLSALLQPINNTGHGENPSIFKYGSTVPVKVEITDCDGSHPSTLDVRVFAVKTSSIPPSDGESETAVANQADAGNQMRFSDPIYVFNWSTKSISDATSTVLVTVKIVATGQTVSAVIGLKSK